MRSVVPRPRLASNHRDRILTPVVDIDEGNARRGVDASHPCQIDACGGEIDQCCPCEVVAADRAIKRHRRTGLARGQRLVRAFTARRRDEPGSCERLAGSGNARYARDEVEVDASEDDDHQG
jgi:hypothetical protein